MSVLFIKRNIRQRGIGFFKNFTFTGDMEIDLTQEHAQIKLLSSGILKAEKDIEIDAFLVGGGSAGEAREGGSAGGNGGETATHKGIQLKGGNAGYLIVIGAGGEGAQVGAVNPKLDGGSTSAFGYGVRGGSNFYPSSHATGSGGGAAGRGDEGTGGDGGTDGGNGGSGYNSDANAKIAGNSGQGTTTRAFGDEDGELYAGGGAGTGKKNIAGREGEGGGGGMAYSVGGTALGVNKDAIPNTGGGGCGALAGGTGKSGNGGSGIVIIRKAVH